MLHTATGSAPALRAANDFGGLAISGALGDLGDQDLASSTTGNTGEIEHRVVTQPLAVFAVAIGAERSASRRNAEGPVGHGLLRQRPVG